MPCYLFTFHAHGSWLPDRKRGYVRRGEGILRPSERMAAKYRANLVTAPVAFDKRAQAVLIEAALAAGIHQGLRFHYLATEKTHAHVLVSWRANRDWAIVRAKLGESLSRRLNRELGRRRWFAKSPSRKRVKDREHFDYLVTKYLPTHSGLKWCEGVGIVT